MMTSMAKFLLGLFTLLILNNGAVGRIYTMNETCMYYPQGYIAHPDDCQSWGYCSGGVLKTTGKCQNGYLYDKSKGMCNFRSEVQCGGPDLANVNICANVPQAAYVAVPNDCTEYCYCHNNRMIECNSCPSNQRYDPTLQKCRFDYICPMESVCRLVKNNEFVASPTACGEYIRCLDGTGTSQKCPNDYFFSSITGYCQSNNPCISPSLPSDNSATTYPPANTNVCSQYNVTAGGVQFMSDGRTCNGYYTCSSGYGDGKWRSCPFGTHFHANNKKCVSPNSFSCPYDRCANINIAFATVPFKNCLLYYVCNNFKQSSTTNNCPSNYAYFDEVNQACVEKEPKYAVCAASSV